MSSSRLVKVCGKAGWRSVTKGYGEQSTTLTGVHRMRLSRVRIWALIQGVSPPSRA